MYNSIVTPGLSGGVATGGALATTGGGMTAIWMALGAFALISAGMALVRTAPKKQV